MAAITDEQIIKNLHSHLRKADEENERLRSLLYLVLPVAVGTTSWCRACGYACDIYAKCKLRNTVLEEAEELGIEVK